MSCTTIRSRLLASDRPDQPAAEETHHLAGCPACRAWLARLVRLEQQLLLLPVPLSLPPAALFAQVLKAAPAAPLVTTPASLRPSPYPRREGGRQKLALALALAAALVLFAVGWWALPHTQSLPPHAQPTATSKGRPYHQLVAQRLKQASTREKRVVVLADLAEEFLDEVRTHANDPDHIAELARHFTQLVQHDLQRVAGELSPGERNAVLPLVAKRLVLAREKAVHLAAAWEKGRPVAAGSLRQIAAAAAEADRQLRQLTPA